jgi:hypothetical protein
MRRKRKKAMEVARRAAQAQYDEEAIARGTAMAMIDELNTKYLELWRTSRCPSCEQIVEWKSVEKHPHHERLNALSGQEADDYLQWTSEHLEDCTFVPAFLDIPFLAARFHIAIGYKQFDMPRPDGKVTRDLVPVRVPAPGDPPVPD